MKSRTRKLIPFALGLALASCASADPTYYTLQSEPGQAHPGNTLNIEIRRPGLAGYLDRSDIVIKSADYKLNVDSQIRWAEPLGDMIGRVLAEDLAQRLPDSNVFTQSGAISADPTLRVEVDILNFDADGSGEVKLAAQLAIERGATHKPLATRQISLTAHPAGPGPANLAATLSALLAQMSDLLASDVRT